MNALETWNKIKKLLVDDNNGNQDTIEWVYRNDCKIIDKFIKDNLKEPEVFKIHDKQMSIDDL